MSRIARPALSALAIAVALSATAAHGSDEIELAPLTISAGLPSDPTALTRAERREELRRIPGAATLVDAESYQTGRSSTLQDSLGMTPGVFIQPRFGAEESRLSIRGSGLQRTYHGRGLLLLQDGAPLNLADGSFDFQSVDALAVDHIEVLRGANAWHYGAANLGGAINFVAPTGQTASPLTLRGELGSHGYQREFISVAGASAQADGYLAISDYRQDGFREHALQENQRYFANFGLRLSERLSTRMYLTHVETNSELPGNLTLAQLRQDARQAAAGSLSGDQRRDFDLNRIANTTSLQLDDGHSLQLSTWYSEKSLLHPIYQVLDDDSEDLGVRLAHHWASGSGWRWAAGVEASHGRVDDHRYANLSGRRGVLLNALEQSADNLNAFTELEVPLAERTALIGGLSWLHAERRIEDRLITTRDESFDASYSGHLGRIGLRHELESGLQLFGNLSQSEEPPTFGELAGAQVIQRNDSQRSRTLEAGLRWQQGYSSLELALYRSEIRDELLALNDASGTALGTINADRTRHQGIELGGALELGAFMLRGQYLYNDFRFVDDAVYGDNRLGGVPSQLVKGEVLWQQGGWYAGPTFEWVPTHYAVDHAASLYADGYAIFGAKAGYRVDSGLSFFIEGRNLADKTYIATTGVIADARGKDSAQFLPGDDRSLTVGLEWKL